MCSSNPCPSYSGSEILFTWCQVDACRRKPTVTQDSLNFGKQRYLSTADYYRKMVIAWTYTTTGPLGNSHYFERIDSDSNHYWHRYNHDGYGEHANGSDYDGSGIGQLWPILSGERGIYEVAAGQDADQYLTTMMATANASGMIPEQIWSNDAPAGYTNGTPTRSMNPLNWAMGEYITLLFSVSEHTIADVVPITLERYASV